MNYKVLNELITIQEIINLKKSKKYNLFKKSFSVNPCSVNSMLAPNNSEFTYLLETNHFTRSSAIIKSLFKMHSRESLCTRKSFNRLTFILKQVCLCTKYKMYYNVYLTIFKVFTHLLDQSSI